MKGTVNVGSPTGDLLKSSQLGVANGVASLDESAKLPAAQLPDHTHPATGIIVLVDRITSERYALIVENGKLYILGVSDSLEATELTLIDNITGLAYAVVIDSGKLAIEEV